jgi:hypothetical protein
MITYGVSQREALRLKTEAEALVGDISKAGSGGHGWRNVDWRMVRMRRGDCAGVGAGGLRRSMRIPILEHRREERKHTEKARHAQG